MVGMLNISAAVTVPASVGISIRYIGKAAC